MSISTTLERLYVFGRAAEAKLMRAQKSARRHQALQRGWGEERFDDIMLLETCLIGNLTELKIPNQSLHPAPHVIFFGASVPTVSWEWAISRMHAAHTPLPQKQVLQRNFSSFRAPQHHRKQPRQIRGSLMPRIVR